jgi:hypothetical protein
VNSEVMVLMIESAYYPHALEDVPEAMVSGFASFIHYRKEPNPIYVDHNPNLVASIVSSSHLEGHSTI